MERADYLAFRREYQPAKLTLVIVAESPPISGKYFYNPEGAATEPLFRAILQQTGLQPSSKEFGLRRLQHLGWLLVDATYEPVNSYTNANKDSVIDRDYPQLREDLMALSSNQSAPIVLIKANVCRLLEERLRADGFKVINNGRVIPFPSHGQQGTFRVKFSELLQRAGLLIGEQPPI